MTIDILCSSPAHPVNEWLVRWMCNWKQHHKIRLIRKAEELLKGDILFLVSCGDIIHKKARQLYRHVLVLHASDLPQGRGWNPHIWSILEGNTEITVTLLNAEDKLDSGAIWGKRTTTIPTDALYDEINDIIFSAEIELMNDALIMVDEVSPIPQSCKGVTKYYRLRTPEDSEIDPHKSIADQFDIIRVADPNRYPAYFRLNGVKYIITLEKG